MAVKQIRDLCLRRIIGAVICNVALQAVLINLYLCLNTIDIFHPLKWFQQWFFCMFSLSTWLYFMPLSLVIIAQGIVCSRDYLYLQPFYRSRISFFIQMFTYHNLCIGFLHLFIGFLLSWIYLSLTLDPVYNKFTYGCSDGFVELKCFSEERMYLILACVFVSGYYFMDKTFVSSRHLSFPIIQLPKFIQIRSQFLTKIKETLLYSIMPNLIFIFFYCLFGSSLRNFIISTFSLQFVSTSPLDTFHGIFTLKRLFYFHFLTSITIFSMNMMEMLFQAYLTEHHMFPICQSVIEESNEIMLKGALQCKKYPIIQHLAYLDLAKLAETSQERRREIYKLSIPGGHPHVWNSIKCECLSTINGFIDELSSMLATSNINKENQMEMTNLKPRLPHDQPTHRLPTAVNNNVCNHASKNIFNWFSKKINWFNNLPLIIYVFGELKEMRIRYILRIHLIIMWSAQTLSFLSCFSLTEDNYGIVQNDLNEIITSLLKLKQILDSLERYFITVYKIPRGLASFQKTVALRNCVKRSLYRLSNAFKQYIADLQLSKDVESKMMSFVNYKE